MALLSTQLVPYAATANPVDDNSPVGGSIDITHRVSFVDVISGSTIEALSSSIADMAVSLTVLVRRGSGLLESETQVLQGTTPVSFSNLGTVDRIEQWQLSGIAVGTITLRRVVGGVVIATVAPGELGGLRLFQGAVADIAAAKNYWQKFFFKNNSSTDGLVQPSVRIFASPSGLISFCLASAYNDAGQSANRITQPAANILSGPGFFDTIDKTGPGPILLPGASIGVWLQLSLQASNPPIDSSVSMQIAGRGV